MAAVSEIIVREYFELHEFLVRQHRKYIAPARPEDDDDIDFFVLNPRPRPSAIPLPFVLSSADLAGIQSAVVVVKGWHTEIFSEARLAKAPEIFRFVEPRVFQQAIRAFGTDGTPLKLLVVPTLPQDAQAREQSVAMLRSKGIDAVLPFRAVLADLIRHTEANRNYQKSDLLQIIRIFKNYGFFKEPQLELFKPAKRRARSSKGAQRPGV